MKALILVYSLLFLVGCDQQKILERFSSPQDRATSQYYIDQLKLRNFDVIEAAMDDSIKSPSLHSTLEQIAMLIPAESPLSIKLVGANSVTKLNEPRSTVVNTTFEYQFSKTWLLINVALKKRGDAQTIVGFNVVPRTQSLDSENAFSLSGKNMVQYSVLGSAVTAALLSLYALVACIRTKLLRRKWLWILFIIVGLGKVSVNWATSQLDINLVSFQLFSASAFAQFYGPWLISVSLPLGAIVFLMWRAKLANQAGQDERA